MNEIDKMHEKTDEELVSLTLENQDYFSALVDRYQKKLLFYIKRISNLNQEDCEDVLQDAFIKMYSNLNDFDTSLQFSSWAYRITHNQVISNFRKLKSRPQQTSFEIDEDIFEKIASDLDITKEIDHQILKKSIDAILQKLDLKYREILVLKFLEEKSYKEISDIIKKPMGTVATLVNRAKKKCKEEIKRNNIQI